MKTKITPIAENIAEATAACLITMSQGNILAFTLTHWAIASQTGVIAGIAASAALLLTRTDNRWVIAIVLGIVTATVDWFVHPGMFGTAVTEAIVTGVGAAVLSYVVGTGIRFWRLRRVPESIGNRG
jgi:hypothetical protein